MTDPSEQQKIQDSYHRDGVVLLKNVLTAEWLERLRGAVDTELQKGERYLCFSGLLPLV